MIDLFFHSHPTQACIFSKYINTPHCITNTIVHMNMITSAASNGFTLPVEAKPLASNKSQIISNALI